MKDSGDLADANLKYSAFAGGPGIFGMRNEIRDCWHLFFCPNTYTFPKPDHINGGTHHFGSPFNFPEEFITVYRLHPMVPDLIEYRQFQKPDQIQETIPVVETFRKKATTTMHDKGLANLALSMGRQRLGRLTLLNHPQFLQNLHIDEAGHQIDVAALDIIRDRERGVPRFNEFRRQYGLRTLTRFEDFIDENLIVAAKKDSTKQKELDRQMEIVNRLRAVYGHHTCDKSKVITTAQKIRLETSEGIQWEAIDDCLGKKHGEQVDNIEDLDTIVGWLAEPVRPHGFAISETQFQVFILNASQAPVQRPILHLQLYEGVLQQGRRGMGHEQRPGRSVRSTRLALVPQGRSFAAEMRAAPDDPRAGARTRARRQRIRSLGARSRRLLRLAVESA